MNMMSADCQVSLKNINMEMLTLSECSESTVRDLRAKLHNQTSKQLCLVCFVMFIFFVL